MEVEIGTIETVKTNVAAGKKRGGGGTDNTPSNRNRDGGDFDRDDGFEENEHFKPDVYRVGMGLILLVVMMTSDA